MLSPNDKFQPGAEAGSSEALTYLLKAVNTITLAAMEVTPFQIKKCTTCKQIRSQVCPASFKAEIPMSCATSIARYFALEATNELVEIVCETCGGKSALLKTLYNTLDVFIAGIT